MKDELLSDKKRIDDLITFLKEHILECEPNTGCGRCDELRNLITAIDSEEVEPRDWMCHCGDDSTGSMKIWACNICGMQVPDEANPDKLSEKCKQPSPVESSAEEIIKNAGKFPYDKLHDVYTSQRVERDVSDKEIRNKALEIVGYDRVQYQNVTQEQAVNFITIFARWMRNELKK